jgi:hypothetical protein
MDVQLHICSEALRIQTDHMEGFNAALDVLMRLRITL